MTQTDEDDKGDKKSPLPDNEHNSFITTCFIPSLTPREGQTSDGLRYRRGSQHPETQSSSYLQQQQQQQQLYVPAHQQQHYDDPPHRRLSNPSHKSDALFYVPFDPRNQHASPHALHPGFYQPPYEPPSPMHPPNNFSYRSHRPFHEAHNPYGYSEYGDSDPGFYPRRFSQSLSYRTPTSDSEWSGYTDTDYYGRSYYDFRYSRTPPQHRRYFQRHRSLDYTSFPMDYLDYPPGDLAGGQRDSQDGQTVPPRKYRSQLELFTTGTGRVAAEPDTGIKRSQSEDVVLDTDGIEQDMGAGFGRNQMPLSEELAAAIGDSGPSHITELELELGVSKDLSASSSAQKTPIKATVSPSSSLFTSTKAVLPAKALRGDVNNSNSKHSLVSSIFIPTSPSLTLTPATPEVSKLVSDVTVSATSPESSLLYSATPVSKQGVHISGQNLPALAGNLRSLPQGKHSTPLDQPKQQTTITITTSSGSSGTLPTPVTSAGSMPGTRSPKVFSSSSSASASAFRSRKPKSCDILDDDDDVEFSHTGQSSSANTGSGNDPPASSASYVSHAYYESRGRGGIAKKGPVLNMAVTSPFTSSRPPSQHSDSLPGSPSLKHRRPGSLSSPSRRYPTYHGYPPSLPHHHRSYSSSSSSLPPMPFSAPPHPLSFSRGSDDLDGYFSSSVAESSSDLSFRSTPEWGGRAGILNSRKLARLINQPIYFKVRVKF